MDEGSRVVPVEMPVEMKGPVCVQMYFVDVHLNKLHLG